MLGRICRGENSREGASRFLQSRGGKHPCLPWSRGFQPGGKSDRTTERAGGFVNHRPCERVVPGGKDAPFYVSQGWLTLREFVE
jgi:hypothetical protein